MILIQLTFLDNKKVAFYVQKINCYPNCSREMMELGIKRKGELSMLDNNERHSFKSVEGCAKKLITLIESKMRGDIVSCCYCGEWVCSNTEYCEEWGILPCVEENQTSVHHCDPYLLHQQVCFFCGSWGEPGEDIDIEETMGLPEATGYISFIMHPSHEMPKRDLINRNVWECHECRSDLAFSDELDV